MVERKIFKRCSKLIENFVNKWNIMRLNVKIGEKCLFQGIIGIEGTCRVLFHDNVRINSGKQYNIIGGDTRTVFRTVGTGKIDIGCNSGISNSTFVAASSITIGENVLIGGSCKFYDTDFHPIDVNDRLNDNKDEIKTAPIEIQDNVFIGAHCIVLKGVTIGQGSVIGAGSVVTKSVPERELWAGNPAHFIRKI